MMKIGFGKQNKVLWLGAIAFAVGMGSVSLPSVQAQDLKAELDALDDLPEDDLSGFSPSEDGGIPDAGSFDQSPRSSSASNGVPSTAPALSSSSAKELGVGDLDLQGLEQELNFDSFGDGGKVGLDQLQTPQNTNLGGEIKGRVTGLDFKQLQDRVRLVVSADRPIDWTRELRSKRRQVIVELRNMDLSREILKRALDTGEFEGPVALVQAFPAKVGGRDSVKILFQLRSFVDPTVLRTGNDLVIDFPISGGDVLFRSKSASTVIVPRTYLSATDLKEFKGGPISLNVKDVELGDFLNLISRSAGKNFVISGTLGTTKKITMNLSNVPWDQALAIALFNNGLGYQDLDSVIRIATTAELSAEMDVAREANLKMANLIPIETRLIPVNYADVTTLTTNITPFLTKERGNVTVEKRTNTLVVSDVPSVLEKIDRYVRAVDKQTPLVLIEARIVEASEAFTRSRQFAWSANQTLGATPGETSGLNVGSRGTNVPINNLNLRFANLGSINLVDTFLGLSETQELVRAVSSPRVTVLANEEATISQGRTVVIPRGTDESGNPLTVEITVPTTLTIKPQVSSDGFVFLDVEVKRDILTNPTTGARDNRSAKTKMVVESGKTAVIGGVYQNDETVEEIGMPFLRKIPIFGNLFTNSKTNVKNSNELLIFISPRILNPDTSRAMGSTNMGEGDFSASVVPDAGAR